jgi:hypothetical protein
MLLLLTSIVFFLEIYAFLKLSWKSLCGKKKAFLYLETMILLEVFLSITNSSVIGKKVLEVPPSDLVCLERYMYFFNSTENTYVILNESFYTWKISFTGSILSKINTILTGQQGDWCYNFSHSWFSFQRYICISGQLKRSTWRKHPISILPNQSCRKCSFQNLTQFSQGNNVLDAPTSNINGFFLEIYVFLKWTQFSWGNNVLDAAASKRCYSLERHKCFFN